MTDDRISSGVNLTLPREGVAVVGFAGEHDLTTQHETRELLARLVGENELVVVDLCAATFIDSSFLNCLLAANREASERQHELRLLVCDAPNIESVLKVSGIAELLTIITSRNAI